MYMAQVQRALLTQLGLISAVQPGTATSTADLRHHGAQFN